jgi:hypothetical protein
LSWILLFTMDASSAPLSSFITKSVLLLFY